MVQVLVLVVVCSFFVGVRSLDNGLALTPPMGWLTWERFRCNKDCVNYPDTCIGERLLQNTADLLVSEGYRSLGYEYIILDDCWLAPARDAKGKLQPDPHQFPRGIKPVIDYVHSKGLKFGVYGDFGTKTCAGYPGSQYHIKTDAQTFADWGADYVKFDACHSAARDMDAGYSAMKEALNQTGRRMVFACEQPLYEIEQKIKVNFQLVRDTCNLWRSYIDIDDFWERVLNIIDWYGADHYNISAYAGPGGWNDPDELVIGNFGLSRDQERVQMAVWTILAAPLIMSTDLKTISNESKALLQNKRLIAINQDKMGKAGKRIKQDGDIDYWARDILPTGSHAVAITYRATGYPLKVTFKCSDIGLTFSGGYVLMETFEGYKMGHYKPNDHVTVLVNPTGVFMFTSVTATVS